MQGRKDIYQEKPITFTIKEGIKVAEAVRKYNVILLQAASKDQTVIISTLLTWSTEKLSEDWKKYGLM